MPLRVVFLIDFYDFGNLINFLSVSLRQNIFQRLSFPVWFDHLAKCIDIFLMNVEPVLRSCRQSFKFFVHPCASAFRKDNAVADACGTISYDQFLRFRADGNLLQCSFQGFCPLYDSWLPFIFLICICNDQSLLN